MNVRDRQTIVAIRERGRRVRGFWERVTGGFELEQLWGQFLSEARSSYGLYSHDVNWDEIRREPKAWKKPFRIAWALFQAMLMKLTPARRVLLLIAIVLVVAEVNLRFSKSDPGLNLVWAGAVLLFVILALELADRVTMKRDLEIAREIQQWLVPANAPQVPGLDIAFATRPQNTVAGDCYDAFLRPAAGGSESVNLVIAVADVAGKSVPAALLMATFQASLRALAGTSATLEENVAALDRYARAHSLEGRRFTTAFLAEVDRAARTMRYVNAGHNAPILLRRSGAVERLALGGPPFGLPLIRGAEPQFECGAVKLEEGDSLFIFTDGVIDALNDDAEEFGETRLLALLRGLPAESASGLLNQVMAELDGFVGSAHQQDDITWMVLRVCPEGQAQ